MRVYNEEIKKFLNGEVEFNLFPGMFYLEDIKAKNIFIISEYNYNDNLVNIWHYENNIWVNEWINPKELSKSKINEIKYYINELNRMCALMYIEAKDILSELLRNGINKYMKYVNCFYTDNNFNMHWVLKINSIIIEVIQDSSNSQCMEITQEEQKEYDNKEDYEVEVEEYDIDDEDDNYFEGTEDDNSNNCIGDCTKCKYQDNCIDAW